MENLYADILVKLVDAKVKFVVAGGVASLLHGVERLTLDIASISKLIEMKKRANRPKDLSDISELEKIQKKE